MKISVCYIVFTDIQLYIGLFYRLKDKFELTLGHNELTVDDVYTLYEIRFGHEKALKINDFFMVLKIAFPSVVNQTMDNESSIQGLVIHGLQVKMCILQDGK